MSLGTYWALRGKTPTRARCHSEETHGRALAVIAPNANRLNTELATLRHRAAEGERISAYLARSRNLEVPGRSMQLLHPSLLASVLRV
jgi:hypothetical protein